MEYPTCCPFLAIPSIRSAYMSPRPRFHTVQIIESTVFIAPPLLLLLLLLVLLSALLLLLLLLLLILLQLFVHQPQLLVKSRYCYHTVTWIVTWCCHKFLSLYRLLSHKVDTFTADGISAVPTAITHDSACPYFRRYIPVGYYCLAMLFHNVLLSILLCIVASYLVMCCLHHLKLPCTAALVFPTAG